MFFSIIVIIIAIDQLTKYLISSNFTVGQSIPFYKDLIYITSVRNTGAAYNILQDHTRILTYATMVILGVVLLYVLIAWKGLSKATRCAFAFILGGGIANLIDRYFLGYVVDFIDVKIIPVFNFADIMICIGCGLLVLDVLIIEPIQNAIKKSKEKKAKKLAEQEEKASGEAKNNSETEANAEAAAETEAQAETVSDTVDAPDFVKAISEELKTDVPEEASAPSEISVEAVAAELKEDAETAAETLA